ncbi:selenium metabolism-associated LysR family transcriptional regulator [Geomonas paludis]|uniref:LysR family transcriptional regulator n=1 Tax=Geomonas paludis TaxID=2740185 RepID=A0A6V8MZH2_9BACT|nr:selenium metabolism-associated LysR family transcriptional regulator [Geomonas paludis]UPU34097.1 selenium metabolism-associated LysR family transcriptional regulator [Geomonas paludis]GFO65628.1 LysR family transcriptional regulator [Geomonas paludis]
MNLKQLEVFINVAESGSFSKGAEASYITQSTVSQHISALESEFGMKLLDRTGRGAFPTEGGKILLERARKLVEYAREIPVALARFKGIEEAVLNIAGSSIPGEYMIPAALPLLIDRFPGVTIVLRQGDSRDVLGKLLSEEVELGVVGGRFDEETLELVPFAEDELVLIARAGHRWGKEKKIGKDELLGEPVVLRETGSGTGKAAIQALREAGIDPAKLRVAAHLGSNESVKRAVISGIGVSFVSAISVWHELEQGTLIQVPVDGVSIKRQFYLASRKGRELSPAAQAFRNIMLEMFKSVEH